MVSNLFDIVIRRHQRRDASELHVEIEGGWLSVRDDGSGIPPCDLAHAVLQVTHRGHAANPNVDFSFAWPVAAAFSRRVENRDVA